MGNSCSPREYCPLFAGLSDGDYAYALRFFSAAEKKITKGEMLKLPGDSLGFFAFVISGTVQVYMDDVNGNRMVMNTVGPGMTFGESLCFLGRKSYAYIQAAADTVLLKMNAARVCAFPSADQSRQLLRTEIPPKSEQGAQIESQLRSQNARSFSQPGSQHASGSASCSFPESQRIDADLFVSSSANHQSPTSKVLRDSAFYSLDPRDVLLSGRFTKMLAARTLTMNRRIQILSKLTIREKILTFLSQECAVAGKNTVKITLNREDMAAYLGTNCSALSRELSKMKKEGILDYRKNIFRILSEPEPKHTIPPE